MSSRYYNSSASGSQSPASEIPSNNASPALLTTPLSTSRASDETDSQSNHSRGTPNRMPVDLPRSTSVGRGGCWTCRLRRKKCDEQREGDSCHTCNRLRIKCLGWGTRRPDWMRDKQAVEAYKADIKAQLTRAGLIRGQPRSSILQTTSAATTSSSSVFSSHTYQRPIAEPRVPRINRVTDYTFADPLRGMVDNASIMPMFNATMDSPSHIPIYHDSSFQHLDPTLTFSPLPLSSQHDAPHFDSPFEAGPQYDPQSLEGSPISDQGIQREHVSYYFAHVCKLQYAFAGNSLANLTYSLVLDDPQGPVANSICALASLHYTRSPAALGAEIANTSLDNSQTMLFHNSTVAELSRRQGHISDSDAIAALHLLTFSILSGGVTDWRLMNNMASIWLSQTGITANENPKLAMMSMSSIGRLALKKTMWVDIMSSLTCGMAPKHLLFYRRLYRGGSGYWANSSPMMNDDLNLRMECLTGCPDEVLLGIAEISTLAQWKAQEIRKGALSMRELIRRGDAIEQHIRSYPDVVQSMDKDQVELHQHLSSIGLLHDTSLATASGLAGITFPTEDVRQLVAALFREAAVLYLHTVLSDANPGVPEIITSIDVIIQTLGRIPASGLDHSLLFPICIAGCLTDDPVRRQVLKGRLDSQHEHFDNIHQIQGVMQAAWHHRDMTGAAIDWRQLLREQNLLLV
ncbi:fungal-specific transcription factor domain-containing protein [Hygrophoropsis aurantiaca]|uniref:Fungal-specific transcription factor domain-containing protein n=1 Tax=Hygrophoropsis aurantiaca TaxID=72124 RepID=A0ACB8AJZ1_9AGAM|nr:fungal-specific transcription factor domain-containing protein [Hygrophoropsis aurantiaca]